ncbi:unannotated protein [freshwater metagenome]|uniref:Unannotated protein n=1 Tax=freshwater metagenome TaxID=449393 RepID=A0A6J6F3A1_9ZZZZ
MFHLLNLDKVGIDDASKRDFVEVNLLAQDEVKQQVEGTLED